MPHANGPAFTIPGYTTLIPPDYGTDQDATLYAAEGLLEHPAFWLYFLSGPLGLEDGAEVAFDVDVSQYQTMCVALEDPDRWPAISLPLGAEVSLWAVFRNFEEDSGLDYVQRRKGGPATVVASVEGHGFTSAMSWADLLAATAIPDERLSWAQRIILMLPMLGEQELPADAVAVVDRALEGIGAANRQPLSETIVNAIAAEW